MTPKDAVHLFNAAAAKNPLISPDHAASVRIKCLEDVVAAQAEVIKARAAYTEFVARQSAPLDADRFPSANEAHLAQQLREANAKIMRLESERDFDRHRLEQQTYTLGEIREALASLDGHFEKPPGKPCDCENADEPF